MEAESDTELTKGIKAHILTYLDTKYSEPEYISTSVEVAIVKDKTSTRRGWDTWTCCRDYYHTYQLFHWTAAKWQAATLH